MILIAMAVKGIDTNACIHITLYMNANSLRIKQVDLRG